MIAGMRRLSASILPGMTLLRKMTKFGRSDKPILIATDTGLKLIGRDRRSLWLDLFEPVDFKASGTSQDDDLKGSSDDDLLQSLPQPTESPSLRTLYRFRQLHHLKLTGMLESYQPTIWAVCWLQPFLQSLHLEMALPPAFGPVTDHPHRLIDTKWTINNFYRSDPNLSEYIGNHGDGTLHEEFGEGEYLDSQAIKMAQQEVAEDLPFNNGRYLPIEKLSLKNFAIDGGALARWFDPKRFRELELKEGCVDAGLFLTPELEHVKIVSSKPRPLHRFARAVKPGDLKIVELKKGKVLHRRDAATGREELAIAHKQPGLRNKVSQLMLGLGGRNKENRVPVDKTEVGREVKDTN
jgi:hypothetical protein